jgi:hypothetical protein
MKAQIGPARINTIQPAPSSLKMSNYDSEIDYDDIVGSCIPETMCQNWTLKTEFFRPTACCTDGSDAAPTHQRNYPCFRPHIRDADAVKPNARARLTAKYHQRHLQHMSPPDSLWTVYKEIEGERLQGIQVTFP